MSNKPPIYCSAWDIYILNKGISSGGGGGSKSMKIFNCYYTPVYLTTNLHRAQLAFNNGETVTFHRSRKANAAWVDDLTLQGKLDYGKVKSLFKKHIRRYYKNKEVVIKSEFQERQLPHTDEENTRVEQSHSHAERTHRIKRQHSNTPQAYTCHRGQNHIWKNVFCCGIQPEWYQTTANKW